ncbi:hypothetical protein [Sphingosinicella sp. BN140058]|uniref:DUF5983 family protein n=1 Tax=Sphingosinicella sp. BN140058 TaxID=1892855 RepID=UPI0019823D0B|nr:hypothetical protein [Sphingosinicella sp. BN140058]
MGLTREFLREMKVDSARTNTRIEKFANLSTAHLTDEVRWHLDKILTPTPAWRDDLTICDREYGYWVRVPAADNNSFAQQPECLRACFELAAADGASWILFDVDEDPLSALPDYDNGAASVINETPLVRLAPAADKTPKAGGHLDA